MACEHCCSCGCHRGERDSEGTTDIGGGRIRDGWGDLTKTGVVYDTTTTTSRG